MKFLSIKLCILLLAVVSVALDAAVTNLQVKFRAGKTYITWTEEAGAGKSYNVYRSSSPITSVSGLAPLVNVPDSSSYDKRYGIYHVIEDTGKLLTDSTGLFVYTPKVNATVYYAITVVTGVVENNAVVSGQNTLDAGVSEEYWKWPLGVLRKKPYTQSCNTCEEYAFFYWMDYFDWPNKRDYYGDWYYIVKHPNIIGKKNLPVEIYLKGWNSSDVGLPYETGSPNGVIMLNVLDRAIQPEGQSFWYGVSNNYGIHAPQPGDTIVNYTEMRIVAYLKALANDSRFSVDTNRFYLTGGSMGGMGTTNMAMHCPDLFAAHRPYIAFLSVADHKEFPQLPSWDFPVYYGNYSQKLTARNGINIYKWMNPTWVASQNIGFDFPPIINCNGSIDDLCPPYWHANLLQTLNKTRHGIWGKWVKVGHNGNPALWGEAVPGDYYRFKKNELYPAFSNATQNDNYGHIDSVSEFGCPYKPSDFTSTDTGMVNGYIDWTSELHKMGLPNDSLIDCADSISITFKSSRANTKVDITPRRLQNFKAVKFSSYSWRNIDVVTGNTLENGVVSADSFGLITVLQFSVSATGNKLIVKKQGASVSDSRNLVSSSLTLSTLPNPFSKSIQLKIAGTIGSTDLKLKVYNINGRVVYQHTFSKTVGNGELSVAWNCRDNKGVMQPAGSYLVKLEGADKVLSKVVHLMR